MFRFAIFVSFCLGLCLPPVNASAQGPDTAVFAGYDQMRAQLDDLIFKRRIADLLTVFGGADEMSPQDMTALEAQVRRLFPEDFTTASVVQRQQMLNGFAQEMIAYHNGNAYIYVRVLWHDRGPGDFVSINMTFNSNPDVILNFF